MSDQHHINASKLAQDVAVEGLKLSPGVTVYALTLNEWVAVATLTYLAFQISYLAWKWVREWRATRVQR